MILSDPGNQRNPRFIPLQESLWDLELPSSCSNQERSIQSCACSSASSPQWADCNFLLCFAWRQPVLALEEATLTVTNTNERRTGFRSALRSPMPPADGDTIQFDAALNGQTITLTSGELVIAKTLLSNGPGPGSVYRGENPFTAALLPHLPYQA